MKFFKCTVTKQALKSPEFKKIAKCVEVVKVVKVKCPPKYDCWKPVKVYDNGIS